MWNGREISGGEYNIIWEGGQKEEGTNIEGEEGTADNSSAVSLFSFDGTDTLTEPEIITTTILKNYLQDLSK